VPDDVIVTDWVAGVLSWTLPNATLVELSVRLGVVAFKAMANVFDMPAAVAVSAAVRFVLTAVAVAVKLALVDPDAIVTEAGTVTALLLLVKVTTVAAVAPEVSETVQASVPAPVRDPLLQERALSVAGACPVPLRLIVAVAALLLIATEPVKFPDVVGSKLIVSVAVCPGFSVTGNAIPESPKPVPITEAALMVSAAVPEDVSVTVFVTVVFSASVPKARLVLLSVSPGVLAFRARLNVFDTPAAVAVSVAVWFVLTAVAVAVKLALVAPDAIVTEAGTVTALLLLVRATAVAVVAADVSDTVQASVPAPVIDPLLQESALSVAGACPVPLRLIVAAAALLLIATEPVKFPAVVGSKLIVSVAV
jgi:hypothetical protein